MEPVLPRPESLEGPAQSQDVSPALQQHAHVENAPNRAPELPREGVVAPQPMPLLTQQPTTAINNSAAPTPVVTPQATPDPQIADDVDVIEKEWVDKAKKIVTATKDNPHQQEKEVSKLQADYLMKRYNKQVKISE